MQAKVLCSMIKKRNDCKNRILNNLTEQSKEVGKRNTKLVYYDLGLMSTFLSSKKRGVQGVY